MKKVIIAYLLSLVCVSAYPQNTITGIFTQLAHQPVKLFGFNGMKAYAIDSVMADKSGVVNLSYSENDYGMGYLVDTDNQSFFVVLSGERIKLKGVAFDMPETIETIEGNENQIFEQYVSEHFRREQALNTWNYLAKIYARDSLFSVHGDIKKTIGSEAERIKYEDNLYLTSLSENAYISYYLPLRKLVSSVSTIAQYRTEEIPATLSAFRKMDYTDPRLQKSGLLADVIDSHFWLIENSGRSLDSVYIEMQISIDVMLKNLMSAQQKLNVITSHLFKLLEKRSLFRASEYLALKLLNEKSCTLTDDFAAQLEIYRTMKKGATAPDIVFSGDVFVSGGSTKNLPKKLSDIKDPYKVVVFGASWCPKCPTELQDLARHYTKWKQYGIEVIFISLDEEKELFKRFVEPFPFMSVCDYRKWDSLAIKDYHVFATPTLYLLNDKGEILLKPNSVGHLEAWVNWDLLNQNK